MKYIDAERLNTEIDKLYDGEAPAHDPQCDFDDGYFTGIDAISQVIDSFQQEQSDVDLEKFTDKIKTFQGRYKYPEIVSIKGAMAFMARMFYQYPNIAREWYDNLPKVTMD